jgi:hypothetical protein
MFKPEKDLSLRYHRESTDVPFNYISDLKEYFSRKRTKEEGKFEYTKVLVKDLRDKMKLT